MIHSSSLSIKWARIIIALLQQVHHPSNTKTFLSSDSVQSDASRYKVEKHPAEQVTEFTVALAQVQLINGTPTEYFAGI